MKRHYNIKSQNNYKVFNQFSLIKNTETKFKQCRMQSLITKITDFSN